MASITRWLAAAALAVGLIVTPIVWFRCVYDTHKRLRVVEPGRLYRSGQMTAKGFADAVESYRLRTIINVQDEYPDPDIDLSFWDRRTRQGKRTVPRIGRALRPLDADALAPPSCPATPTTGHRSTLEHPGR